MSCKNSSATRTLNKMRENLHKLPGLTFLFFASEDGVKMTYESGPDMPSAVALACAAGTDAPYLGPYPYPDQLSCWQSALPDRKETISTIDSWIEKLRGKEGLGFVLVWHVVGDEEVRVASSDDFDSWHSMALHVVWVVERGLIKTLNAL